MFTLIDTCEHLELVPLENERDRILNRAYECEQETDETERNGHVKYLMSKDYEPHCEKKDCPCVVCESLVLSQQYHGVGNLHQPFIITLRNIKRIRECTNRKIPDTGLDMEPLDVFLLTHIQRNLE